MAAIALVCAGLSTNAAPAAGASAKLASSSSCYEPLSSLFGGFAASARGGFVRGADTKGRMDVAAPKAAPLIGPVTIPVYVHVIRKGTGFANGDVPDSMIND
jgi:hypothetical protein